MKTGCRLSRLNRFDQFFFASVSFEVLQSFADNFVVFLFVFRRGTIPLDKLYPVFGLLFPQMESQFRYQRALITIAVSKCSSRHVDN